MIQIYLKDNEKYEQNGDLTLTPTNCRLEAVLNGEWELTLEHLIDDEGRWKYIETDNVISCPTFVGERQLFRIYQTVKNMESITAYARPIFFDCRNTILLDVRPTGKNGQNALNIILAGTKFTGSSNISIHNTAYYVRMNILNALMGDDENSFLNRWGGECIFNNHTVVINDRAGGDYGVRVEFGRNLEAIEENISYDNIVTRIVPVAYNGRMLDGATPWVDSPNIGRYANIYMREIKFEDVKWSQDDPNDEDAYPYLSQVRGVIGARARDTFGQTGCDMPEVNYKVNMIQLANTDEYADYAVLETVGLGDTVHCQHKGINIDMDAKAIRVAYDCIGRKNTEVELGNFKEDYFGRLSDTAGRIDGITTGAGEVKAEKITGVIDAMKAQLRAQKSIAPAQDVRAILFEDLDPSSPTFGAMCLGTQGFQIASGRTADDRDWDWRTFGTGKGFAADLIVAGTMMAERISGGTLSGVTITGTDIIAGGQANEDGTITLKDAAGTAIVTMDVNGIDIEKGKLSGVEINLEDDGKSAKFRVQSQSGKKTEIVGSNIRVADASGNYIFQLTTLLDTPMLDMAGSINVRKSGDMASIRSEGTITAQDGFATGSGQGKTGSFTIDGRTITVRGGIITDM